MVDGQAVGGLDVAADDHQHVGAVQRGPHDAGSLLVPVGPEHDTAGGQEKSMRLRKGTGEQRWPVIYSNVIHYWN